MKINYQKLCDNLIKEHEGEKLLLHVCCGPCSTYVLEYLGEYFPITVFYNNPNIYPEKEYLDRVLEAKKVIKASNTKYPIDFVVSDYNPESYFQAVKGLEELGERSDRCKSCFELRLENSAQYAKENGYKLFTTSLSISPHKDAQLLNRLGEEIASKYEITYLFSDFKKKGGYLRSIEISKELDLYRQEYCGCIFSKREFEQRMADK